MKRFNVLFLLIVLLKSEFVKTSESHYTTSTEESSDMTKNFTKIHKNETPPPSTPKFIQPTTIPTTTAPPPSTRYFKTNSLELYSDAESPGHLTSSCKCQTAVYVMASIIVILCLVIIVLLLVVYKLKKKTTCGYDDKIEITKTDSSSKYTRQLSSETSEVTFTRENSNDDGRFKLTRQASNMSIVGYPNNQDVNKKKREESHSSTSTLNKIIHQRPIQMQKDQIKAICEAVLQKTQKRNECTSLSNLDKFVNEGKLKELDDHVLLEKSASSGILDAVDSCDALPSPLTVKKVINNFELSASPATFRKFSKAVDNKTQTIDKTDDKPEDTTNLLCDLPLLKTDKVVDIVTEDDIYDNLLPGNRPVSSSNSKNEHVDDIYVNPPNNRPVSLNEDNNEHIDDFYDNPLNNKPVGNADDYLDEIYDNPANNKPVYKENMKKDDINDDIKRDKLLTDKSSYKQEKVLKDNETNGNVYDSLPTYNKEVVIKSDDPSGYSVKLTTEDEPFFDSSYVNARSFQC